MPRAEPHATRGGRTISPKKATETGSSPITRSRASAAPRSKVKPLIPLTGAKSPKPARQPRTIAKGSIPRKPPEPEEDGEWDFMGVCFLSANKESTISDETPLTQHSSPTTLTDQEADASMKLDRPSDAMTRAGQSDKMPHMGCLETPHQTLPRKGIPYGDTMQSSPSRRPGATSATNGGQELSQQPLPRQSHKTPTHAHRHQLSSAKRNREKVQAEETDAQPDPIRRPSTRRDIRRSESIHPPPSARQRAHYPPQSPTFSGGRGRAAPGSQGEESRRLPRNTLFGGVVEMTLSPPTPSPPRARQLTYTARRSVKAGLPVPGRPVRPPSRQAIGRPAPPSRVTEEVIPASRRKVPERSLEIMKDHEMQPGRPLARSRGSSADSGSSHSSPSSQSSRASGIGMDELEDTLSTPHLRDFSPTHTQAEAETRRDERPRDREQHSGDHHVPVQRGRRRVHADHHINEPNGKRRKLDPSSTARSERDSFHLPSPASPPRNSAPKPLSRILDPHQFRLHGEAGMRLDGWHADDEVVVRRFRPVKGGKGGRKTIMIESNTSPAQLKLSRNQSVAGRLQKYSDQVRNERRLHPFTPTRSIIPSPKALSKRPTSLNTARGLPLAAFKPRQRKNAVSDPSAKGFQAIDQNLVAAGNRDLLDKILASGAKKGRSGAGTGKKRPQTPPHHQHLRSGLAATTERQAVEHPEPIREFTPAPQATQPSHDFTPVRQTPRARLGQLSFVNTDPVPRGERAPLPTPTTRLRLEQQKYEDQWERDKAAYLRESEDLAVPPPKRVTQVAAPAPTRTPPTAKPSQVDPPIAPIKKPAKPSKTVPQPQPAPMTPTRPAQHPPTTHLPLPTGRPPLADITTSSISYSLPSVEKAATEVSNTQLLRDLDDMLAAAPMSDIDAEKLASELDDMLETFEEDIHGDEHFAAVQPGSKKVVKSVQPEPDTQGGMSGLDMTEHILKTLHLLHDEPSVDSGPGQTGEEAGNGGGGSAQKAPGFSSARSGDSTSTPSVAKSTAARRRKGKKANSNSKNKDSDPTQGKLNFRPVEPIELESQIPRKAPNASSAAAVSVSPSLLPDVPLNNCKFDTALPESTPQVIWSATPTDLTQPMPGATQRDAEEIPLVEYQMADPGLRKDNQAARDRSVPKPAGRGHTDTWRAQTKTGAALKSNPSLVGGASPRPGSRPKWATDNAEIQDTGRVIGLRDISPTQIGTTPGKSSGIQESSKSFPIAPTLTRTQTVTRSGAHTGRKKRTIVPASSDSGDEAVHEERDELDDDSTEEEEEVESPRPRPAMGDPKRSVNPG